MKKLYGLILGLICIFLLSSCGFESKKVLVNRTEINLIEDFDLVGGNTEVVQANLKGKCAENELSQTRSGRWGTLTLASSKKVIIEEVSYTIYNKTEDKSFYIYDYKGFEGGFADDKKSYVYPYVEDVSKYRAVELKPGEEVNIVVPLNGVKLNKKAFFYVMYGFAYYINGEYNSDNIHECVENGGICNLKMKYSIYM